MKKRGDAIKKLLILLYKNNIYTCILLGTKLNTIDSKPDNVRNKQMKKHCYCIINDVTHLFK